MSDVYTDNSFLIKFISKSTITPSANFCEACEDKTFLLALPLFELCEGCPSFTTLSAMVSHETQCNTNETNEGYFLCFYFKEALLGLHHVTLFYRCYRYRTPACCDIPMPTALVRRRNGKNSELSLFQQRRPGRGRTVYYFFDQFKHPTPDLMM